MPYTSSVIAGERLGQYELGRFATQVLAGFAWRASPRWDVSLEYKFTATTVDGEVARGDSESRLHTKPSRGRAGLSRRVVTDGGTGIMTGRGLDP